VRHNSGVMARLTDRPPAPPPGSPFLSPAPRPQRPPAARELQQRAAAALFLAVLSIIAMTLIGSWQRAAYVLAVACVVALTGFVLAISAMRAAKRAGTRRPRVSVAAAVLSGICAVFAGLATISFLFFGAQLTQFANCMNAAGSSTAAQNACQTGLQNAITARVNNLGK
jgi:predicted PurR-regulated permease PerM